MAKRKRRPCPRGLYDGCPIPRELCSEAYGRTGEWRCIDFLRDFERFLFGEADAAGAEAGGEGGIVTLEQLMRVLEGMDGKR